MTSIVICDDDERRVHDWATRIKGVAPGATVQCISGVRFATVVRDLKSRMARVRQKEDVAVRDEADIIDHADILVLDSDLTPDESAEIGDDPEGLVATHLVSELGAEVAHLARAYSDAAAIVIVNQGAKQSTFDLRLTRFESGVADAYLTDDELDNGRLWGWPGGSGYRPWAWPNLGQLPTVLRGCASELDLNETLGAIIGIDDVDLLPHQVEILEFEGEGRWHDRTLGELALESSFGLGLRPKEQTRDRWVPMLAVAAARRWLDRIVIPSQTALIDLPHLIHRNPWVLHEAGLSVGESMTKYAWHTGQVPDLARGAYNRRCSELTGRNVWSVGQLPRRPSGFRLSAADPVFCEDTSSLEDGSVTRDFESDIQGPYSRRYVRRVPGVSYTPLSRLMQ